MTEKNFLSCLMAGGAVLLILGLCILILPRLTQISYGVMLSGAFITYGLYKIITAIMNRAYGGGIIYSILSGILLLVIGVLLLFVPKISLLWLIELIGIYFMTESISAAVYSYYFRNRYNFWGSKLFTSIILFMIGILVILGVPVMSFWLVTVLSGIAFIIKGFSKITLAFINIRDYKI